MSLGVAAAQFMAPKVALLAFAALLLAGACALPRPRRAERCAWRQRWSETSPVREEHCPTADTHGH